MKTSEQWWNETKSDPDKLDHWLKRQYVGEIAAVNLLSKILLKFSSMPYSAYRTIHSIMMQEALHASWVRNLLDGRGIVLADDPESDRRYWSEVIPNVDTFEKAMAAAHNAEGMRLARIRAIVNDEQAPSDIRKVFQDILPHEEWHEEAFGTLKGSADMKAEHQKGLNALSLVLE
jgi:hypothetical protein